MSEEIVRKTYNSVSYRLIFQILQQGTVFILAIILARLLSPEEFGIIALANLVIHYANNLSDLGFTNALVQTRNIDERHANSVFTIDFLLSFTLGIITFFTAGSLATFFKNDNLSAVLKWMSLYYIISTFHYLPIAMLRRNLEFKYISINEYINTFISYTVTIILAFAGFSYWSIVYPTLFFTLVWSFVYMYKARWLPKLKYSHHCMKEIYSFGFWNFIRTQLSMLVSKIDYFVIGKYLRVHELGIYEKSFEITERTFAGLSMPINSVYFSSFSRLQDDKVTQKRMFFEALKMLLLLIFPAIIGLIAISKHFVHSLLGEAWLDAVVPIRLLASAALFKLIGGIVASLNIANGFYKIQTYYEIVTTILLIGLCFALVKNGIVAISIGIIIYAFARFVLNLKLLKKTIHISIIEIIRVSVYPIFISIVMLIIVFLCSELYLDDSSSIWQFISLFFVGVFTYISLIFVLVKTKQLSINFLINFIKTKKDV